MPVVLLSAIPPRDHAIEQPELYRTARIVLIDLLAKLHRQAASPQVSPFRAATQRHFFMEIE
jgi:hypothetical protein